MLKEYLSFLFLVMSGIVMLAQSTTPAPIPPDKGYIVITGKFVFDQTGKPSRFPFSFIQVQRTLKLFVRMNNNSGYELEYRTLSGVKTREPIEFIWTSDNDSVPFSWEAKIPELVSGIGYNVYHGDKPIYSELVHSPTNSAGLKIEPTNFGRFRISPQTLESVDVISDGDEDWDNYDRSESFKDGIFALPKEILNKNKPTWLSLEIWRGLKRDVIFYRWDPSRTRKP